MSARNTTARVAVCSRSFSQHPILRAELLERYEHVTFNAEGKKLAGPTLVEFLRGHDKAITALEVVTREVLEQLPELRVISKYGVGLDMIDQAAMQALGKRLGWQGGVNRRSVAELALTFMISALRLVPSAAREVLAGEWRQQFGRQLTGRTVGIVGCGHIGKDLTPLLAPLGCRILVHDIVHYAEFYAAHGLEPVELDVLLESSDVVTLHLPLDDSTRGIIDARRIGLLQPGAVLINTARGGLVNEGALLTALVEGRIAGAAFDVFASEPPTDRALLDHPNFLATPHIGGSAQEAVLAMGRSAIRHLDP